MGFLDIMTAEHGRVFDSVVLERHKNKRAVDQMYMILYILLKSSVLDTGRREGPRATLPYDAKVGSRA